MLSRRINLALLAIDVVAGATLIRSIAYDRWITVLAAVLMLVGAAATRRGRTWGVALTFAAAAAFPVAWAIGIAPAWFAVVGVVGALPFAFMTRAFARFDLRATMLLATIAASLGASGAIAWKHYALETFAAFPFLTSSVYPHHGLAIIALLFAASVARSVRRAAQPAGAAESSMRVRVADDDLADTALPAARSRVAVEGDEADATENIASPRRARAR